MVGMGNGWPSRTDYILVSIRIQMWICGHFSTSLNITRYGMIQYTRYTYLQEDATTFVLRIAVVLAEIAFSEHVWLIYVSINGPVTNRKAKLLLP